MRESQCARILKVNRITRNSLKPRALNSLIAKLAMILFAASPSLGFSWGEKGHHIVCDEATRLIKEEGLKALLKTRGHMMGHLCNIPDIHWKSLPSEVSGIGNPAHFLEPDMVGLSIKDLPTSFPDFMAKLAEHGDPTKLVNKVGSLWWRVDQLNNLAIESGKKIAANPPPQNFAQEQQSTLEYNVAVYGMMLNMGIMGHFLGDASMPYHNWADYDGFGSGHGGIHAYYEGTCPGEYGSDFNSQVHDAGLKIKTFKEGLSAIDVLKLVSTDAVAEVPTVEKLDKVLEPSTQTVTPEGMSIKKVALRPDPALQCPNFRPLITTQMAKSAKALAFIWDQIYIKVGRPGLAPYKSYRYPLAPVFIVPDYLMTTP